MNSQTFVAVYGASGYGREVMPLVKKQFAKKKNIKFYFVDDANFSGEINSVEVLSYSAFIKLDGEKKITIAIADANIRRCLQDKCISDGIDVVTILSDNCVVMDEVIVGDGAVLSPFVTLTSNIKIGVGFHANIYSYIAHDCIIGDYVTFAPSVKCNGNIHIEDEVYIGTGAIIKQGSPSKPISIGKGAVIGMGSVVTKSVAAGDVVFGVPAKSIKRGK